MKKILCLLIGLLLIISCSAQNGKGWRGVPYKANFQDSTNFTKVPLFNGLPTFIVSNNNQHFTGVTTLDRLRIGGLLNAIIDSITNDGSGLKFYSNGSPLAIFTPAGNGISISLIKTIAHVIPSSGDTSNYPIPGMPGMVYIDTTGGHEYHSNKSTRNGWIKIY